MFKLHEGRYGQGTSLPSQGRDETASSLKSKHPAMISKISKVLQKYHNPDPISRLIGPANETLLQIKGKSYLALIDSGAQLSALPESLVEKLKLKVHNLNTIIEAEATGGSLVPYTGYVEARLSIPGIKVMNQNSLFMVVKDNNYTNRVPVQLGTLDINEALAVVMREEYRNLSVAWARANFPPRPIMKASEKFNHDAVKTICTYSMLKLGSSRVSIGLRNLSCRIVTIKSKTVVATVVEANLVPFSVAPNLEGKENSMKSR